MEKYLTSKLTKYRPYRLEDKHANMLVVLPEPTGFLTIRSSVISNRCLLFLILKLNRIWRPLGCKLKEYIWDILDDKH